MRFTKYGQFFAKYGHNFCTGSPNLSRGLKKKLRSTVKYFCTEKRKTRYYFFPLTLAKCQDFIKRFHTNVSDSDGNDIDYDDVCEKVKERNPRTFESKFSTQIEKVTPVR